MTILIIKVIVSFISSMAFGIVFQIRGKNLIFAGISGAIGYFVYLLALALMPEANAGAIFLGSCAITTYSECMARVRKSPATVFLVAGLIPIVPGRGMYRCMYLALEGDLQAAAFTCYQTLLEAGAIAIGVVTVSSLFRLFASMTRRNERA